MLFPFSLHFVEAPTIVVSSEPVIDADATTSILLTCVAIGLPSPSIHWLRDNTSLIEGTTTRIYHEVFEMGGRNFTQSFLELCSLSLNDSATFTCLAQNGVGMSSINLELSVQENAQIVIAPRDVNLKAGDTALATCVTQGASPVITWSRMGTQLNNGTSDRITLLEERYQREGVWFVQSTLQICDIVATDSGIYTCLAVSHSTMDTSNFTLSVQSLPTTLVIVPSPQIFPVYRSDLTLTCVALGYPLPQITWSRNNEEINNGSSSILSSEVVERDGERFIQSTLFLCSDELETSFNLTCSSDNGLTGGDTPSFSISVNVESKLSLQC